MEFRFLGPLEAIGGGGPLPLGPARQRAALALLLVRDSRPVSLDQFVDQLWVERPPASAEHAVQVYVSGIRKALRVAGADVIVRTSPSGYVLDVHPDRVDARRFERLVGTAERSVRTDPPNARELFENALGMWRGPPLAEFEEFEFARAEADRLEELHTLALEGLIEAKLDCAEHAGIIGQLTSLVAANPLRERPRRLLMLSLYRLGRPAEALATYRDACAALDEVGLRPGPELRRLEAEILRHDQSLQSADFNTSPVRTGRNESPAARPSFARRRKMVSVLCCDLTGSPAQRERLDPETWLELTEASLNDVRDIVESQGGTVIRFSGDAAVAIFGVPRVQEDDALRAVRAAAEIRDRVVIAAGGGTETLRPRAGLSTGLAVVDESKGLVLGDVVRVAARFAQAADAGDILLSDETLSLVRDAIDAEKIGPVTLNPGTEPVAAFRLLRVVPESSTPKRAPVGPIVGRARELGHLRSAWERVVAERGCHLFTLLGVAGIGKSRLVDELLGQVGRGATVLSGRCLHYGDGITFWPVIEALTSLGSPARPVVDRITAGATATPQELFWEIRQVLEVAAADRPVLLHVDDLQWAEPMLLDLLDHIVEYSRGVPILLLCVARPELVEKRPTWAGGKLNATSALLEGLPPADCELLLGRLDGDLGVDRRRKVVAVSGGNPLFLEELVALTRDRGTVSVPPTIQAVVATRVERLEKEERELIEPAAVEGEVFHLDAIQALYQARPLDMRATVAELVRKDVIRPQPGPPRDDDVFRFRHVLIRDAIYESLAKAERAQLHEWFAVWLRRNRDLFEIDEVAGWHLEQAVTYQRELGRAVAPAAERRAAEHLHAAGRRAAQRSDTVAARKLLERAHALASRDDGLRARIAVDLAEQLMEGGDLTRVDCLLSAAERNPETAPHAALIRFHWLTLAQPDDAPRKIDAVLRGMIARLEAADDQSGLAKAHLAGFWAKSQAGTVELAGEHALCAARHARNAGDEGLRARGFALYVVSLFYGPYDAAALTHELDAIEAEELGPYVETLVTAVRSEVARLTGNIDHGRRLMRQAIDQFKAMGIRTMAAACENSQAWGEMAGGEPRRSIPGLLEADAELANLGERGFRSTVKATLALVYEWLGDLEQARVEAGLADELSAAEDYLNVVLVSLVRSRLSLRDADTQTAERWARHAVEAASQTDIPFVHGEAQLQLARALAMKGSMHEARRAAEVALEWSQVRGDQPRGREASALLTGLGALAGPGPAKRPDAV